MYKYLTICKFLCVFLCLFFFTGCKEEPPKPPPKPKVIRKKITAKPPKQKESIVVAEAQKDNDTKKESERPVEDTKNIIAPDTEKKKDTGVKKPDINTSPPKIIEPGKEKTDGDKEVKKKVKIADASKTTPSVKPEDPEQGKSKSVKKETDKEKPGKEKPGKEKPGKENLDKPSPELASISDIKLDKESDKYLAYNPKGKIDPFKPLFREDSKKTDKKKDDVKPGDKPKIPDRIKTPLEKLDLGQLKLVGIINAESGSKALVEEASGKGYIIVKGTYIGIHSGKVTDILRDRIIVEEEDADAFGKKFIRKRELKFQRPTGDDYYEM